MSMNSVFTQIGVILLYVLVGLIAGKARVINPQQRQFLTRFCSNLVLPFTILSASSQQPLMIISKGGLRLCLCAGGDRADHPERHR